MKPDGVVTWLELGPVLCCKNKCRSHQQNAQFGHEAREEFHNPNRDFELQAILI